MTFQEKSLWATLAGLLVAFGAYFWLAWATLLPMPASRDVMPQQAALFMAITLLLVSVLVVGHVAIAIRERRSEPDERDRWIALKGSRNGGLALACGVFAALCTALVTEGNAMMAHVLLGAWALAQGVEIISQLIMYRRGA